MNNKRDSSLRRVKRGFAQNDNKKRLRMTKSKKSVEVKPPRSDED